MGTWQDVTKKLRIIWGVRKSESPEEEKELVKLFAIN